MEILTIGAELLAGDILDTNCRELARAFRGLGLAVCATATVDDVVDDIAEAVKRAWERSSVVVVTGGLGPTPDDCTRLGVARALGVGVSLRAELVDELKAKYLAYGHRDMPEANLAQVTLPDGAVPLPNPLGTAPGFRCESRGHVLFAVPGVPREMRRMLEDSLLPWLRRHRVEGTIHSRVLRTMGLGESEMVDRHGAMLASLPGVDTAYYPQLPGLNLKLTARGEDDAEVLGRLDAAEATVRAALAEVVYGVDGDTLPQVVGELLRERGWRVSVAESCTGGNLAAELISASGASDYFDRGVVAYSNRSKQELLGVDPALMAAHGAVSEPVVRAMAEGIRHASGVEVALATTGIAGPTGATETKPVGLVFSAIATPETTRTWRSHYPGSRFAVVRRAVAADLNRLRLVLLGKR